MTDHADDLCYRGHQSAYHVGVKNHLVLLALLPHGGVVGVQLVHDQCLGIKAVGIDINAVGFGVVYIADAAQDAVIAGSRGEQGAADQIGKVGAGHVELDRVLEGCRVDLEGAFYLCAQLRNVALDSLCDLLLQLSCQLLDGGADLALYGSSKLGLQCLAQLGGVGLHDGLHILLQHIGKLFLQPGVLQQIPDGFRQQLLEGFGLHIGRKAQLVQIQQTIADEIALVAVHDLFHQLLQRILRKVQLHTIEQLPHIHIRQRQFAQI